MLWVKVLFRPKNADLLQKKKKKKLTSAKWRGPWRSKVYFLFTSPNTSKRTKPTQIKVKTNHCTNHVTCKNKLRPTHLGITPEKAIRNWNIDVKVKCFKYFDFHLYELFVWVRIVANVLEIINWRRAIFLQHCKDWNANSSLCL